MGVPADDLFDLDPDDPRTPSQQIANALRAAILTERLAAGERLPSQLELARRYGVARETVKSALRILDREELIVSRQGSGAFVRERRGGSLDLRALLRSALDRPHVSIDYAGFRGETLSHLLPDALADVRAGRSAVRSLRLRLLLADPYGPLGFPRPVDATAEVGELPAVLARLTTDAVDRLTGELEDLTRSRLLESATIQVRVHQLGPSIKAYVLNDTRVIFGFYPVTEYSVTVGGQDVALHHPSGWDATVFDADDGTALNLEQRTDGPPFTDQLRHWFETVWSTIARDFPPSR